MGNLKREHRSSNYLLKAILIVMGMAFSASSFAERVSIPVSQQGDQSIQKPLNGLDMANVESQYGSPFQVVDAIGEPPISRWVYQDFTVYFEHNVVIHTVVHKS